jgi:hypothetical protein
MSFIILETILTPHFRQKDLPGLATISQAWFYLQTCQVEENLTGWKTS